MGVPYFVMAGIIPPQDYAFFCDESGISNDRFTVVGGLCVHRNVIPRIHKNIEDYREKHNMKAELKWAKISNQKLAEYRALVEYFFAMNNQNLLQFHCVIFDNHRWNHKAYNDGDGDIGLSKLYYQLLHHKFGRRCGGIGSLFVCLDYRISSTPHETLRRMLNNAAARDHGVAGDPYKQIVSVDSKCDDLLQLNDVILGAVSAAKNGRHILASTRAAKRELAELVLSKSGAASFDTDTPKSVSRFSVWNFRAR
jgi:hypothetical protein